MSTINPRLSHAEIYRLNDELTQCLAALGWTAHDEDDMDQLNDAVLDFAASFFETEVRIIPA